MAASDSVRVELPGKRHNRPLSSLRRKTGLYSMPERAGQTLESRRSLRISPRITVFAYIGAMDQAKTKVQGNVLGYFQMTRCFDMMTKSASGPRFCEGATTLLSSSMAEHPAVNRRVVGSSPT